MRDNGNVKTGSAAITKGNFGSLKCKYIIHAVGPIVYGRLSFEDIMDLRNCIKNILELAKVNKVKQIAIPAISSGIFGFPKSECAKILVGETLLWIKEMKGNEFLNEIRFTNNDSLTCEIFKKEISEAINENNN